MIGLLQRLGCILLIWWNQEAHNVWLSLFYCDVAADPIIVQQISSFSSSCFLLIIPHKRSIPLHSFGVELSHLTCLSPRNVSENDIHPICVKAQMCMVQPRLLELLPSTMNIMGLLLSSWVTDCKGLSRPKTNSHFEVKHSLTSVDPQAQLFHNQEINVCCMLLSFVIIFWITLL